MAPMRKSMKLNQQDITWVILSGGQSSRMGGVDKGFIRLHNKPLIEHVYHALSQQTDRIMISANRNQTQYQTYAPVLSDVIADFPGPLGGIHAALSKIIDSEWIGFVPCDSPTIPADLIVRFCHAYQMGTEVLVAHDGQSYQPVFVLFHRSVLAQLSDYLAQGERKLLRFIHQCQHNPVDFSDKPSMFINLNTPRQLAELNRPLS